MLIASGKLAGRTRDKGNIMNLINKLITLVILGALSCSVAQAQSVVRGPYLQTQTSSSIVIRWRTDVATDSVVRYGPGPGNLSSSKVVGGSTTEHSVSLTGLGTAQQYYYSVGDSSGPLAGDSSYHFHTAPTAGIAADTRIWVIGDSGTANANASNVYSAFRSWSGSDPADFWLMLGDNAYSTGTDSEYQAAVFDMYPEFLRQLPLWATLGNHDAGSASSSTQSGVYYDIFEFPRNAEAGGYSSGTEAYYSFDYANIHFICLNSQDVSRAPGGTMMQWLESDLAMNAAAPDGKPWVIAFWHHPPYTKGSHNSDSESQLIDMRQNALPILESWGVDLVLTGHSHSYERSFLLDGHYGVSTTLDPVDNVLDPGDGRETGTGAYEKPDLVAAQNAGAVYAVAGSSGKISGGSLDHPAMFVSLNSLGSLVLDVSGNRMDVAFLDQSGVVQDEFTLLKTPDSDPPLISGVTAEDAMHVLVDFNEPLNSTEAMDVANYSIDGLSVSQVDLLAGDRSVRLTTSVMDQGVSYTLAVNNLRDLAGNIILPGTMANFDYFEFMTVSFQDGLAPSPEYNGTRDAFIHQATPTTVHGLEPTLQVDGDDPSGTGNDINIMLSWDISAIPANAIVETAQIQLQVTNPSTGAYYCYTLLKSWQESQATWNLAATGETWSVAGAAGATDRGNEQLCTVNAGSTGLITVSLTPAGLSEVQAWVNSPSSNQGLIISNSSTTDGADFHSRESTSATARPRLEVTYRVPITPGNVDPVADFSHACTDLSCDFTDLSSDSDGFISDWSWSFGDSSGSVLQNPTHTFSEAGDYTVSLTVSDDDAATDVFNTLVSVTSPPAYVDQVALSDLPSAGSVSGSFVDTHANGGAVQSIRERVSGGKKRSRYSYLSHTWQFSVVPGSPVTLYANAWSSGSGDGDNFVFAWSSNNSSFTNLFTVSSQNSSNVQSSVIPASGTVYIRVTDTNRTARNTNLDTIYIDQLYIRSDNGTPPSLPGAPTGLQVKNPTTSSLDLTWSHPGTDEASFDLERAPASGGPWAGAGSPAGGSSTHTDGGLSSSTTYFYRIRARNSAGASAWSNIASGKTSSGPPPASIFLTANGHKKRGYHIIDLSWTGANSASVDVVRDGAIVATTSASSLTDEPRNKGGRTYVYKVCLEGTDTCSDEVSVVF